MREAQRKKAEETAVEAARQPTTEEAIRKVEVVQWPSEEVEVERGGEEAFAVDLTPREAGDEAFTEEELAEAMLEGASRYARQLTADIGALAETLKTRLDAGEEAQTT